jgi:hypothetical protein
MVRTERVGESWDWTFDCELILEYKVMKLRTYWELNGFKEVRESCLLGLGLFLLDVSIERKDPLQDPGSW